MPAATWPVGAASTVVQVPQSIGQCNRTPAAKLVVIVQIGRIFSVHIVLSAWPWHAVGGACGLAGAGFGVVAVEGMGVVDGAGVVGAAVVTEGVPVMFLAVLGPNSGELALASTTPKEALASTINSEGGRTLPPLRKAALAHMAPCCPFDLFIQSSSCRRRRRSQGAVRLFCCRSSYASLHACAEWRAHMWCGFVSVRLVTRLSDSEKTVAQMGVNVQQGYPVATVRNSAPAQCVQISTTQCPGKANLPGATAGAPCAERALRSA